ncbi:MAG TPA: hypothetical protein P5270_08680, partial [Victivallales bacterium]|nr:hypothetical protein [Victivallales bacterium]
VMTISSLSAIVIADDVKGCHIENAQKEKCQTICPVMGGKINKNYYVDTDEGRVYFCCPGCVSTFKKDQAKYLEKLKNEGVQLEKIQTKEETENNKEQDKSAHQH